MTQFMDKFEEVSESDTINTVISHVMEIVLSPSLSGLEIICINVKITY